MLVIFYELNIEFMYNNQRAQNIKQGAFFDYFKCFAFSASQTIRKLQRTFHQEFSEELGLDSNGMLKRVQSLLSGYEVLILQINDSCQFVEIPEFGVCILKIFYQLMSVVKYLASCLISKSSQQKPEKERRALQRYTMVSPNGESKGEASRQQRETLRSREKASHIFKELTLQIKNMERQSKSVFKENQESLEKIIKRREKLQEIESSQSEAILAETASLLFKRGEHINNFLNLLQSGQNQYQIKETQTYAKLKQLIEEENSQKIAHAKQKLNQIFKEQINQLQRKKKSAMQSEQIQVKLQPEDQGENSQLRKSQYRKTHTDQAKKMKMEIRMLEEENATLKDYVKEKIEEYEGIATRLRAEKITLENKLANLENSTVKSKGSIDIKKSQSNLDPYENLDNMSQIHSHLSLQEEHQRQILENGERPQTFLKKSKINLGKNIKTKVKFLDNHKNLELLSKIMQFSTPCSSSAIDENSPGVRSPIINKSESNFSTSEVRIAEKSDRQEKRSAKRLRSLQKRRSSLQMSKGQHSSNCSRAKQDGQSQQKQKEQTHKHKNEDILLVVQSKECQMNLKQSCDKELKKSRGPRKETISQPPQEVKRKEELKEENSNRLEETKKQQPEKENLPQITLPINNYPSTRMPSRFKSPKPAQDRSVSVGKEMNECPRLIKSSQQDHRILSCNKFILKLFSADLIEIFLSEENAKNYQILNLSLSIKQKRYFSTLGNKTVIKELKNAKVTKESDEVLSEEPKQLSQAINYLSGIVFKVLSNIKRDKKTYKKLCNFIRYPHSSIYLSQTAEWNSQEDEVSLQYAELRKLVSRMLKLHVQCSQAVCQHLRYFLRKIGVQQK